MSEHSGMRLRLADGTRLYCEVQGRGFPVVLIHGLRCSHVSWRHQAPALAEHYQAIAIDLRGHGQSDAPPGPYSAELFADDVRQVLDHLGLDKAVVVGHSLGGGIAQTFAFDWPARLTALGLVATSSELAPAVRDTMYRQADLAEQGRSLRPPEEALLGWVAPKFAQDHPEELAVEAAAMARDPLAFAATCRANAVRDWTHRLGEITCPTLFVGGDLDRSDPRRSAERYRNRLPDFEAHILPGVGHMVPMEAAGELNRLLLAFLRRVSAAAAP